MLDSGVITTLYCRGNTTTEYKMTTATHTLSNTETTLEALAKEFCEVREIAKMAEERKKALQKQILEISGEGKETLAGAFKISHKVFTKTQKVPVMWDEKIVDASRFDVKFIGRING